MDKRTKNKVRHIHPGGRRPGSGRKPVKDKVQVTIFLRRDTVEALRTAAGSPYFAKFLQEHLDRHPVSRVAPRAPSRYITRKLGRPTLSPEQKEERRQAAIAKDPVAREYFKVLAREERAKARAAAKAARAAAKAAKKAAKATA